MTLISSEYVNGESGYRNTWYFDSEGDITAQFDPASANGSMILAIDTSAVFVKNSAGRWQKLGSGEVV